ncbi:MAG: hydrolase, partial [Woeseiaceae bacterium]|nr:hydrolase [Woeseiaceae bacterium]NIP22126.1 hydrolase [Woeseiaceae bacterium]
MAWFLVPVAGLAQSETALESLPRPETAAVPLKEAPVLDGDVFNDPAWQEAIPITGFTQVQPLSGNAASKRTEVRIGFTETALWIAVIAYDSEPQEIIVSEARRDSSLDETDSFRFVIDGFLDRQNGYVFGTNPTG